jgi:hypothetical protein
MVQPVRPYAVPNKIEPNLARVMAYWESLKRSKNDMPFWDDVNLFVLPDLSDKLMLVDLFEEPVRFRFNVVGQKLTDRYGEDLGSRFADEIQIRAPLQYLLSQGSATIEGHAPTYYQHVTEDSETHNASGTYSRILLPMWGDGHIGMLLGAVVDR